MDWRLLGGVLVGAGICNAVTGFMILARTPECPVWLRQYTALMYVQAVAFGIAGAVLVWSL